MGKNDKWDHNYEPDESKVSWALFWKMMRETDEAGEEMAEEAEKRTEEKFKKSWYGKRWTRFANRIKRTKGGSRKLAILQLTLYSTGLVILLGLWVALPMLGDLINPPAYQLTQQQKDEGYDRTCSGGGKSCTIDDVAYRFLTDSEYKDDASCLMSDNWCLYAIPLKTDCTEIVVEAHTTEKDGLLAPTVETFEEHHKPQNAEFIQPGERVTIGIVAHSDKSQFLAVDAVYCYGSG